MKKLCFIILLCSFFGVPNALNAQKVAIKTNLLYWGTTTPNISVETALGLKTTLDIQGSYNPFTYSNNRKLKHWAVQPEFRWWWCEKFNGSFFGFHAHYAVFNFGNLDLPLDIFPGLRNYRYEGSAVGLGFSYGYQWYISPHWNLEAQFGFGYTYADYDRYECHTCGPHLGRGHKHYFGPTKIGLSFVYLFGSKN